MDRFGVSVNMEADAGFVRGRQEKIACKCWFTSTGRTIPLMIEYMNEEGELVKIHQIQVLSSEAKNFAGIRSYYYRCRFHHIGREWESNLVYYPEKGQWVMNFAK